MTDLREAIPDFEGLDKLGSLQTVADLAKSYLEVRREMDSTARMPGDNAPEEDKVRALRRLGQVKAPEDYSVEGIENPQLRSHLDKLRDAAFESGVSKAAWSKLAVGLEQQTKQYADTQAEHAGKLKNEYLHSLGEKAAEHTEAAENALRMLQAQNPELAKRFSLDNPDHMILLSEFGIHVKPSDGNQPNIGSTLDAENASEIGFEEAYQALRKSTIPLGNDMKSKLEKKALCDEADALFKKHVTDKGPESIEAYQRWRSERDKR